MPAIIQPLRSRTMTVAVRRRRRVGLAEDHPPGVPDEPEERQVHEHQQQRHPDVLRTRQSLRRRSQTRCGTRPDSGRPDSASAAARNIGPVHGIARPASVISSTCLVS